MAGTKGWSRQVGTVGGVLGLLGLVVGSSAIGVASNAGAASKAAPIVVGGQATLAIGAGIVTGFKARIDAFNKAGGLSGRKIQFIGELTTAFSATTSQANTAKLVENDHVMVDAPVASTVSTPSATKLLATGKVPFFGWTISGGWANNHYGFGINGQQVNPAVQAENGMIQTIQAMEKTKSFGVSKPSQVKMALMGLDDAGATFSTKSLTAAAKAKGITVVYSGAPIPITATNYAPYASTAVGAGANAVYCIGPDSICIGLAGALKAAGFKGVDVNGVTYFPGAITSTEESALTGTYVEDEFPSDSTTQIPAVKTALKQLKASGFKPALSSGASVGYWSADVMIALMEATAKRVGAAKVTGATMQATAAKGWTYTGGLGKMTYPRAWTYPTGCGDLVKEVGTTYKLIEPYHCYGTTLAQTGL